MAQRELYVFSHVDEDFVPAGRLRLTEQQGVVAASSFSYGLRYLDRPRRFELDPVSLSLADPAQVRGVELFPANGLAQFGGIRDAAPDAWGRRVIEAQRRVPANSLSEAEYLLGAGSDRVGALDVRDRLDSPARFGAGDVRSLGYLLEASERIERGEPIPARLADVFGAGPSAGGARPKASVRDAEGVLWLAKFPSQSDTFDVAAAECWTLQLASLCGMCVPALKLLDLGGRPVLLIRRFDRYWQDREPNADLEPEPWDNLPGNGRSERRLPFVSGLTLVGCDEFESREKSYADLALAIRDFIESRRIRPDREELFARMIFNIFVSNDDDHLRNHGFIRDPRLAGWRLSPLYDVVPRPGVAHDRFLHLGVGRQGKLATLDNAMSASSAFMPQRADAVRILHRVWGEIRQWKTHFEGWRAPGRLVDKLAPAFRSLDDICSPALQAEIRRSGEG
ncbi:type II toxin-antitoxin system HipA family toxin [Variovorax sp. JS1663]|uniref:type II toxin-antitoxin system HipA family toxin n=1 Tax=Variovorax sp. JS1663 TaxID=1851577 RepID=UPI000B344A30|nr:HipA domain-containing protein [Variovorax sp. JS1663]OUM00020.1 phosphatidylinositol kinase [Variovorax sp. JS1663]